MEELNSNTSKSQIRKLGKTLREESKTQNISAESLLKLQEFRVSYKSSLSTIFNILAEESRKIRKSRVVTYRVKRIESVISKLNRFPNMHLAEMIDVAGCRCIVDSNQDIYNIKEALEKRLDVFDVKDYIKKKPLDDDGYSALHLYVRFKEEMNKPIEIQIRTRDQHNWATFVEIIDVIYNTKIKEGQKNPELQQFCFLLSTLDRLNFSDSVELLSIEKKYNVYSKLSEVFNQNYILTRKKWLSIENKKDHKFFIIEVDQEKRTHIESFSNFEIAEQQYLKKFNNDKTNIVLTHLEAPSYKQLSIAYSNYILSMHKFQEDICSIAKTVITEYLNQKDKIKAKEIQDLYLSYANQEAESFKEEINELTSEIPNNDPNNKKVEEWLSDMSDRMVKRSAILLDGKIKIGWEDLFLMSIKQFLKGIFKKY
ncbi:MAG: RelA/SpoT domain-containing protein [Bacteroidetes bacterium]|nr:RelA/SpoT domain-containing protein [Bacteroidota bacterium]